MKKTYFISGHLDLTESEFNEHYISKIQYALNNNYNFVIGDARGADSLAQKYLLNTAQKHNIVTIYHMFEKPRNNYGNWKTIGGFKDDDTRDSQMTYDSDDDILWIRSIEEQKKRLGGKYNPSHINGTTKNAMRRLEITKKLNNKVFDESII